MDATGEGQPDYLTLSGDIVSAFGSNNPIPATALTGLIADRKSVVKRLGGQIRSSLAWRVCQQNKK
ncbi:hypothetical protein [Methylobacterium radiotolerans]|uniref:hypothetical protein n=1 Tax=Methylobacterium radiotolerans TaxID=31998 RepID=UPI001FD980FB|nr:hypothetical protein [Methylobacterium radiotolerans]